MSTVVICVGPVEFAIAIRELELLGELELESEPEKSKPALDANEILTTGDIMAYKHPSKESIHQGRIHSKVIDAGEMYPPGDKCHLPDPVGPKQTRAKHITKDDFTAERPAHLAAPVMEDGMHDEYGEYDPNAKT